MRTFFIPDDATTKSTKESSPKIRRSRTSLPQRAELLRFLSEKFEEHLWHLMAYPPKGANEQAIIRKASWRVMRAVTEFMR
jgi:hypothetical protein